MFVPSVVFIDYIILFFLFRELQSVVGNVEASSISNLILYLTFNGPQCGVILKNM
jgi:hypothetical protein